MLWKHLDANIIINICQYHLAIDQMLIREMQGVSLKEKKNEKIKRLPDEDKLFGWGKQNNGFHIYKYSSRWLEIYLSASNKLVEN